MEQAALANHVPGFAAHVHNGAYADVVAVTDQPTSAGGAAQFYFDDDHELGELGESTDLGCDFGDFGAF